VTRIESRATPSLYTNLATRSRQRREICLHPQLIVPFVRFVAIHTESAQSQPRCNNRSPSFARATPAHRRIPLMTIFATLMLTAIALYVMMQVDDLKS
jgi:hypothetical protein